MKKNAGTDSRNWSLYALFAVFACSIGICFGAKCLRSVTVSPGESSTDEVDGVSARSARLAPDAEKMQTFLTNGKSLSPKEYRELALSMEQELIAKRRKSNGQTFFISAEERARKWEAETERLADTVRRFPPGSKGSVGDVTLKRLQTRLSDAPRGADVSNSIHDTVSTAEMSQDFRQRIEKARDVIYSK